MTPAALSLPIVATALFVGTSWLVAGLLLRVWLGAVARHPQLARTTPVIAVLPWLLGAAVALAAVLPGDPHTGRVLACHCLESMPDWLHLCPVHPEESALLAMPAMLALAALLPGRIQALRTVMLQPLGHGGGDHPRVVALGAPMATLHGWLRPTLVVDRGLWAALSPTDRDAVLAHERGHLRRNDPLVRMVLCGALVVAPRALAARAARLWLDHAELAADAEAARQTGDPAAVAQALVRCARLGATSPALSVSWTGGSLERRVRALLDGSSHAAPARGDLGPRELIATLTLSGLALAATPWIHHQVEHLLNLFL